MPTILTVGGASPDIDRARFVAGDAVVAGDVVLGQDSTLWYGVVVRAEMAPVRVGARTNVQDGTIVHTDEGFPTTLGDDVTIGHRCVVHGCTVEDGALVGMGAVVLNGAVVGAGALVAAGAVVTQGMEVPPNAVVAGVPAKVVKELPADRGVFPNVDAYLQLGSLYAAVEGAGVGTPSDDA